MDSKEYFLQSTSWENIEFRLLERSFAPPRPPKFKRPKIEPMTQLTWDEDTNITA